MRYLCLLLIVVGLALMAIGLPIGALADEPEAGLDDPQPAATEEPAIDPPALPVPGSTREGPVPLGQSLTVEGSKGRFAVRVVRVIPNAFPLLQSYNQFALPPAPGNRQMIVRVQMTNLTPRPDPVMVYRADFSLLGSSPRPIVPLSAQVRDRLWVELPAGHIAEGEIPFEVRRDDTGLVLTYDGDFAGSQRYYFALE